LDLREHARRNFSASELPVTRKASVEGFIFVQRLPIDQPPPAMTENPDEQR